MESLKLLSLNIEQSKHLDTVRAFLELEQPDVLCVQELMNGDRMTIAEAMGAQWHVFTPMSRVQSASGDPYGIAIYTRAPALAQGEQYYVREAPEIPETDSSDVQTYNRTHRMVLWCDVRKGDAVFRIANTHFTWTPDGNASDAQRRDVGVLIHELAQVGECVLVGDFNAPRGREIFSHIEKSYKDNIPPHYTTSLDGTLHRAGNLDLMVDGVFSTTAYVVSEVALIPGVSDHCAIVATVSRIV